MFSSTLPKIDNFCIGKHELVVKLMRAIYNKNPPKPKYSFFWDVEEVLKFIVDMGPTSDLPIRLLTLKTVFLIALATHCRISELAHISRSVIYSSSGARLQLTSPTKTQFHSSLRQLDIKRLPQYDCIICPVASIEFYLSLASKMKIKSNYLFVSYRKPHLAVTPSTIARWIKTILASAGIDITSFSAHSTRGASSSYAIEKGTPIDDVLKTANWRSESTFTKYYRRSSRPQI